MGFVHSQECTGTLMGLDESTDSKRTDFYKGIVGVT